MAHELAVLCNKRAGSGSAAPVKETHVYVRSEYIDVAERRISNMQPMRLGRIGRLGALV